MSDHKSLSPAVLRLVAQVLDHCARLDLGLDIPIPPELTDEECATLNRALGRQDDVFGPGHDATDEETAIALAVVLREAADALECAPAEPLGDDVTRCRACGETIIATPDGSVCLGGHPK